MLIFDLRAKTGVLAGSVPSKLPLNRRYFAGRPPVSGWARTYEEHRESAPIGPADISIQATTDHRRSGSLTKRELRYDDLSFA
jgi:hypothetical protein